MGGSPLPGSVAWTPGALGRLVAALGAAEAELAALPAVDLAAAWGATVEAFLDPASSESREIAGALAERCRLSPAGLAAGLEAVLGGLRRGHAEEVLRTAASRRAGVMGPAAQGAAGSREAGEVGPAAQGAAGGRKAGVMGPAGQGAAGGREAGEVGPAAQGAAGGRKAGSAAPPAPGTSRGPVLVVLASNLPALAAQPLLPILAARRPVLLKSPSAEPLFAPAFLAALVRREPRLAGAVAAVTWPGGAVELEAPVLAGCSTVLAYGGDEALADLARRAPGKVVEYGPKTSLAVVGREALAEGGDGEMGRWETARWDAGKEEAGARTARPLAAGLARDIALFDQRGCLSLAAVYVAGPPAGALALARDLAAELGELARRWPPGPASPAELAAVQQVRLEAELRGLAVFLPGAPQTVPMPAAGRDPLVEPDAAGPPAGARSLGGAPPAFSLPVAAGTVVVEPDPAFRPSPGLRTVRIHPLPELAPLPGLLSAWRGRLQGAALAGEDAWRLAAELRALGVSRCAPPGQLQSTDAGWHNGGIDPLAVLLPNGASVPLD